jgi:RNA polymerase sigma factor (sigma-70 family)
MLTVSERNLLIEQFMPLAKKMAISKKRECGLFANIPISELVSAAYYGLVDAASRYEYKFGVFWNYASFRIGGAMQDYLREFGFGSKGSNSLGCQRFGSLDALCCGDQEDGIDTVPFESKSGRPLNSFFEELVEGIDERSRMVLRLHFIESEPLKQIGTRLGVTEGRVSQIISNCRKELLAQAA